MDLLNPDWGVPTERTRLTPCIYACERLADLALTLTDDDRLLHATEAGPTSDGQSLSKAVFEEFGRAVKTFRACLLLATSGYGQPAQTLAGIVAQSSLLILWGLQNSPAADRRADLHYRYCLQVDLDARREVGLWNSLPADDYISADELTEATALFGPDPSTFWSGHPSLEALVDDLALNADNDFEKVQYRGFKILAKRSEVLTSGSGLANHAFRVPTVLEDGNEVSLVNVGQGSEEVRLALHTASSGLLSAVSELAERYSPELSDQVKRCQALLWRAWKDPAELKGLADGDPCPCDRPNTEWGTCHKWTEELGTVTYEPLNDADLTRFVPYVYKGGAKAAPKSDSLNSFNEPVVLTFTFRLPFSLGIEDTGSHQIFLADSWSDPDDVAHFGRTPMVRFRVRNQPMSGESFWPSQAGEVLQSLYDCDATGSEFDWSPVEGLCEQWVTLETPSARLVTEKEDDGAYAFHRAFASFNGFLTAFDLAVSDSRISVVSTHEIGPLMFLGAIKGDGSWEPLGEMMMHPESFPSLAEPVSFDSIEGQLESAMRDLRYGRLFLLSNLWHSRAIRALMYRGDNTDAVVSLQTAVESMMYDLMRGLLVDSDKVSGSIELKIRDIPYRSLLLRELAPRLGGSWDLGAKSGGALARYWHSLYLLRNRVVHAGYEPTNPESEEALGSFFEIREHVSRLLWKRYPRYPRTLVAKVGVNGLVRRGWMTPRVRADCERFKAEVFPFYLAKDKAGR